ncbi:cation diffusion facilitator CzcD-associated flavoprotein CzcO [Streptacidiphilus sp. MAP12-33]|uniref:hypothetical protein n=1 Tax=Streptacidiphilus sp. MAP12-33 TaxID=3156266 RepID=UPI0035173C4A
MPRNVRVDAVVVGAGPAGLACAADLSAAGRLAMSGYLHLTRACYRLGERWVPAGDVRLRLDSVSTWWLRGDRDASWLRPAPASSAGHPADHAARPQVPR